MTDYTPSADEVKDTYINSEGFGSTEEAAAEFDRWFSEQKRVWQAEALEQFAADLIGRYPEDVFRPLTSADHQAVNRALMGHVQGTTISRDAVSADMMRRAASQALDAAAEVRDDIFVTSHDAQCEAEYVVPATAWTDCGCSDRSGSPLTEGDTK